MEQYIPKSALVAEIEKRIKNLYPKGGQGMVVTKILKDHYEDLLSYVNTIEVKEGDDITWQDVKILQDKSGEVFAEVAKGKVEFYSIYPTEQSFLEEVVRRFKAQKGE